MRPPKHLLDRIKGNSPAYKKMIDDIMAVSRGAATVFVDGETGVGKSAIVAEIQEITKPGSPFDGVNACDIPGELFESEMFGYVRGAFTGANTNKTGYLERVNGGGFLLDELADMELRHQSKLLRVLQLRNFMKVGGTKAIPIDIRFYFATNKDLKEEIAAGRFRLDLYYRVNVLNLRIPPLRERGDDSIVIAEHILKKFPEKLVLSPEAKQMLVSYHWPGNIRELENVIERAFYFAEGDVIEPQQLRFDEEAPVIGITANDNKQLTTAENAVESNGPNNTAEPERLTKEERLTVLIEEMKTRKESTTYEIEKALGIPRRTIQTGLKELTESGILRRRGHGRNSRYEYLNGVTYRADDSDSKDSRVPRCRKDSNLNNCNLSADIRRILEFCRIERRLCEIMGAINRSHRTHFRKRYIVPLLEKRWLAVTKPESRKSRNQRYVVTEMGQEMLNCQPKSSPSKDKLRHSGFENQGSPVGGMVYTGAAIAP